jgi:(1->4)-alpha-D-glucan 1-alpha-D-glucosylmutase
MDSAYRAAVPEARDWPTVAYESQQLVLRRSLASELNVATNQLARIARADRHTRDLNFSSLRNALAEVIACFPVYRTYIAGEVADSDRRYIEWAIATARRRRALTEAPVFDFGRAALLLMLPAASEEQRRRIRNFVMKFQQITAPITAKGIEDTAMYRYNRLISLNEVGGEPGTYGASVAAFHADAAYRVRHWPHEMLATSTHDTKRSEDVRARLNVLSEMTTPWRETVRRWSRLNRTRLRELAGEQAPSREDEYHFYQTLVGSWPLESDPRAADAYRERVSAYMIKAAREAKQRTSWTDIDTAYEEALVSFVHSALEPRDSNLFLNDFQQFLAGMARFGLLNALTQLTCKLTAPGVPDIYQGNEIWDFSLVDPDNRRPVDYACRRGLLTELTEQGAALRPGELLANLEDGRCKLFLTWKLLALRKTCPELFRAGDYKAVHARGVRARHVCAFMRRFRQQSLLVIVPRLYRRLLGEASALPLGAAVWGDTYLELPHDADGAALHNVISARPLQPTRVGESWSVSLRDALDVFPVAVLTGGCESPASGTAADAAA